MSLYHGVVQGNNSEIQNAVFSKRKTSWNRKLEKGLVLSHLQPPLDKNSEEVAILILAFDVVTVKSFLLSSGVQKEVQLGVGVLYRRC